MDAEAILTRYRVLRGYLTDFQTADLGGVA